MTATATAGHTTPGKRFGYVIAAAINAVFLWISHQLLEWGWPRFLTSDFADVLPLISVSFVASIATNLAYAWNDSPWRKSLGSLVTSAISLLVAVATYEVFPFDFSTYAKDWSWLARTVLVIAIVGTSVSVIVESVRLLRMILGRGHPTTPAPAPPDPTADDEDGPGATETECQEPGMFSSINWPSSSL
jgi:hypothetical protein